MESTILTPTASSAVTTSSTSNQVPSFHLLEISVISAQNLAPVSKSMRTYAVTWVHPSRKLTTRTNQKGQTNPTWNDKFAFRVDDEFLLSDNAAVNVEIYTVSWFCDVLVGIVRVPVCELITPSVLTHKNSSKNTRFVALQVRRPSGSPQGILNLGVSLLDSSMKSMPLNSPINSRVEDSPDAIPKEIENLNDLQQKNVDNEEEDSELNAKIQFWRSMGAGSESNNGEFPVKPGSVCNGSLVNESACNSSMVNGSELCSDIGPSASVVAAELAKKSEPTQQAEEPPSRSTKKPYRSAEIQETESSIVEELTFEEAAAKGFKFSSSKERWRNEVSKRYEYKPRSAVCGGHTRRNSDGGLFSCFGNAYGIQFTIVCGSGNDSDSNELSASKSRKKRSTKANSV
ncbi:uncharacterized protein Fot_00126 [Forsythia ovata]|uniref:C2 domain-containing protein n=1 Tax=Forsythia ovata TaxID=205694 RepID=A0ABD1X078_9LAMI